MMQILSIILITIAILIVIYAIGDFLKNININNDVEVSAKLNKIKRRMIIAICVFAIPLALNFITSLVGNVSKLFINNDMKIVEIENNYLDSNYIWNDNKDYYEKEDEIEIIETVNIKNDIKEDKQEIIKTNTKESNNTKEETPKEIETKNIKNETEENLITIYNNKSNSENDNNKEYTNENEYIKNNYNNEYEQIRIEEELLKEEETIKQEHKINNTSIINNNTNKMIVNNQPIINNNIDSFTYYNQCDSIWQTKGFCSSGYSMCNNGCGATALAMIASTLGINKNVTPLDVRDYLCANNLHSNGGMAYHPFTNNNLLNYYGLIGNIFINYNDSSKYDDNKALAIKNEVDNGNGVILLIPGHYIVLGKNKMCNNNQVYMYDPASREDSGCYTMGELWAKTWNRYNRCNNKKKCGWRMAWTYKSIGG